MSKQEIINAANDYIQNCSAGNRASNKKTIGLQNAVDAANAIEKLNHPLFGEIIQADKKRNPERFARKEALAAKFYSAFSEGDIDYVIANYARDWS